MKKKRIFFVPAAVFLGVAVLLSSLYILAIRKSTLQEREKYQAIASNQSNVITGCVDTVVARAYTLSALVSAWGGEVEDFDMVAGQIYENTAADTGVALKNIAMAPDGIVEKVYPRLGNEGLIGFSFLDPEKPGNLEAIAAYQRREMVLTNPFQLVQGGVGMAGRLPVFLSRDEADDFWGLVTVTMDFERLMKVIHMEALSDMGIRYRLWYKGGDGTPVVLASSQELPVQPVTYPFSLRNLTWHLDVAPAAGWVDHTELAAGFAVIFSVALLLAMMLLAQERVRQANKQLKFLAYMDGLTSCYSRHYVNSILVNQRTGGWNDPNLKYSIAMLDIDYFKSINDQYGHEIGDRAILAVAQVLQANAKEANGDCVIRFGGDEFIVLWNDVSHSRFLHKLDNILTQVGAIHFPDYPDLHLTVSIGAEAYSEEANYYDMVRRADELLYRAKENGRNCFAV